VKARRIVIVLAAALLVSVFAFVGSAITQPSPETIPRVNPDSALFEHGGWMVSYGAVPYVDVWDVKPPLVLQATAMLALIVPDDMMKLHRLSCHVTVLAALGSVLLLGLTINEITDEWIAPSIVCIGVLSYGPFIDLGWLGFSPKIFSLFFGLLALRCSQRGILFLSGIAATASFLFYQFGIVFIVIVLLQARRDRHNLKLMACGCVGVLAASLAPIIIHGAIGPMIHQTVISHLVIRESIAFSARFVKILKFTDAVSLACLATGIIGLLVVSLTEPKWRIFLLAVTVFLVQVFFLDLDGGADLIFLLFFSVIGLGTLALRLSRKMQKILLVAMSIFVVFSLAGHRREVSDWPSPTGIEPSVDSRAGLPGMTYILLNQYVPPSCHYRLSRLEREWIRRQGGTLGTTECFSTWEPRRTDSSDR
jgi:hypothetical protein